MSGSEDTTKMRRPKSSTAVLTPWLVLLLLLLQLLLAAEAQRSAGQTPNRRVIEGLQQRLQQPERPIAATNSATTPSPWRHSNAPVPATSSGPVIRLRGSNRSGMPHVGRVEVLYRGRWGVVCDDDWDQNDADIACRMLGYSRGAAAAVGGSEFGSGAWTADDIVLDDVNCDGSEQSLGRCQFNDRHNCDIEELAGVRCHPNPGCRAGQVAANGSCYLLIEEPAKYFSAAGTCLRLGGSLAHVDSSATNDALGELLQTSVTVRGRGAAFVLGQRDALTGKWNVQLAGRSRSGAGGEATLEQGHCLVLSIGGGRSITEASDYFYQSTADCGQELPFVCAIVAERAVEKTKSVATPEGSCQDSEFLCYVLGTCVSGTQRCDGLLDCIHLEDERNCESTLDDYKKTAAKRLQIVPKASYFDVSLERCGRLCSKSREYVCKAFAFRSSTEYCLFYETGSAAAGVTTDTSYDLYELRSQMGGCTGLYKCDNERCIDAILKCNGADDCGDFSDEQSCNCASDEFTCKTVKKCIPAKFVCNKDDDCGDNSDEQRCNELSISIVGGQSIYEGRVEITYNGLRGTICDDEFDDKDAQVICRSFGYTGPAVAHGRAKFGAGSGAIWIDDLRCSGSEPNVAACSRSAWGVSDCKHDEDAAVTCSRASISPLLSSPSPPRPAVTTAGLPAVLPSSRPEMTMASPILHSCGQRFFRSRRALPTGVSYVEPEGTARIIGGRDAIHGAYPWQVGVKKGGSHSCGGTILNDRWILSAAHCFYNRPKSLFSIVVGDFDITMVEPTEETFELEQIILHEQYRFTNDYEDYDFALLKIQPKSGGRGIQFSQHVQPACLPSSESTVYPVGTYCHISGWGSISRYGYPNRLQAAEVPIMDDSLCSTLYRNVITASMFCAGFKEGGIDTCKGDSGGPLVCNVNGQFTVLGVTSFGIECALPNAPGVYAKVSAVLPWIRRQIAA